MKHSGFGLASFIMSLAIGAFIFVLFLAAGVMEASTPGGMDEESVGAVVVGLLGLGLVMLDLLAVVLGIIGLFQKERKKVFAILGTAISTLTIMMAVGVVVLGLLMS